MLSSRPSSPKLVQTPLPIWMQKEKIPAWAQARKLEWMNRSQPVREEMVKALSEQKPAKKEETPKKEPAAAGAN